MSNLKADKKAKSSGIPKWVIMVVVIVAIIVVSGAVVSTLVVRKANEKISEGLIKAGSGGDVEVDTSSGTVKIKNDKDSMEVGTAKWPSDLPENIPAFSGGKIIAATKVGGNSPTWSVIISEANQTQMDNYQQQLISSGWAADSEVDFLVNMAQLTKGDYRITLAFDPSSKGVQITVSGKN